MTPKTQTKRTFEGLRAALFEELDKVRSGEADYQRYSTVVKIVGQIHLGILTELKVRKTLGEPELAENIRGMLPAPGTDG